MTVSQNDLLVKVKETRTLKGFDQEAARAELRAKRAYGKLSHPELAQHCGMHPSRLTRLLLGPDPLTSEVYELIRKHMDAMLLPAKIEVRST